MYHHQSQIHQISKRKLKKKNGTKNENKLLEDEFQDDFLECTFTVTFSRSTNKKKRCFNTTDMNGNFQRFMGSNVVRLTDRKYMKELRQRIADEFTDMLMQRIEAREQKEIERERHLIIEGKCRIVPEELSNERACILNKSNNSESSSSSTKTRRRLKTSREINTERLKRLHAKWEKAQRKKQEEGKNSHKYANDDDYDDSSSNSEEQDSENSESFYCDRKDSKASCYPDIETIISKENTSLSSTSQFDISYQNQKVLLPPQRSCDSDAFFNVANIVLARRKFRNTIKKNHEEIDSKLSKSNMKFEDIKDALGVLSKKSKQSRRTIEKEFRNTRRSSEASQNDPEKFSDVEFEEENNKDKKEAKSLEVSKSDNTEIIDEKEQGLCELKESVNDIKSFYDFVNEINNNHEESDDEKTRSTPNISKLKHEPIPFGENNQIYELRKANSVNELYQLAEAIILGDETKTNRSNENLN